MSQDTPWKILLEHVEAGDPVELEHYIGTLAPSERARTFARLDREAIDRIFELISPDQAAEIIQDLSDEQGAGLIEAMNHETAADVVEMLPINDQIDILNEISSDDATQAIIANLPLKDRKEVRQLLKYEEDTAGGIMNTAVLSYPENMKVGDVLDDLRENREQYGEYDIQYVYVVDRDGCLRGVLPLRTLVWTPRDTPVGKVMKGELTMVSVDADLDELLDLFETHEFLGIPVIDRKGRLAGVALRYEVMEAVGEREADNYLKSSGIVGGEELRSMPLLVRSKRRLSWLSINILLNIAAASVIAMYQDTVSAVIALAVFLPIISDMSGCSGNQAVAVSIREITLGISKPTDIINVILKESIVGLINGIVLGILLGGVAFLWKGNFYLGLVIGGALLFNTIIAVCIGGTIPLVLQKWGKDPALASGPILTTVTDMCGFLLTLGFATSLLSLIH